MNKKYLSISAIVFSFCNLFSQAVPNSSFETWSQNGPFETPNNWNVSPATSKSSDAKTGSFSLQLKTGIFTNPQTQAIDTIPGMASTGQQGMGPGNPGINGFPYTSRPDSLVFWYKYQAQNNDSFAVRFNLTKWNSSNKAMISDFIFKGGVALKYTRITIPIPYLLNSLPDSATIQIISSLSPRGNLILGSTLLIDDIDLIRNKSSIESSVSTQNSQILIYPKPCSQWLSVSNITCNSIKLIDIFGSIITVFNTEGLNKTEILTADLAPGIYFIVLNDGIYHKIIKE